MEKCEEAANGSFSEEAANGSPCTDRSTRLVVLCPQRMARECHAEATYSDLTDCVFVLNGTEAR